MERFTSSVNSRFIGSLHSGSYGVVDEGVLSSRPVAGAAGAGDRLLVRRPTDASRRSDTEQASRGGRVAGCGRGVSGRFAGGGQRTRDFRYWTRL